MRRNRITLSESALNRIVKESVRRVINEGMYGFPDGVDRILLDSENDSECYRWYTDIIRMLAKHVKRGETLSVERLANSSMMKHYQQFAFRRWKSDQPDLDPRRGPRIFRDYVAEKMIEDANDLANQD